MNGNMTPNQRLYDAIGCIDDKLIHDAQSPKKAREYIRVRRSKRIAGVAVACLFCILCTVLIKVPPIRHNTHNDPSHTNSNSHPSQDKAEENQSTTVTLEHALLDSAGSSEISIAPNTEVLDLFDSRPKLIWQYDGDIKYHYTAIKSTAKLKAITTELDRPATVLSADSSETVSIKVWISYGDGRVDSPYLKHTQGNTGYGVLFDYSAEVEPSEKLTKTVLDLIK